MYTTVLNISRNIQHRSKVCEHVRLTSCVCVCVAAKVSGVGSGPGELNMYLQLCLSTNRLEKHLKVPALAATHLTLRVWVLFL